MGPRNPDPRRPVRRACGAKSLPQEFKPTRVGVMAAVLLLLRYEDSEQVAAWWRSAQQDEGTKDSYGLDGVQSLVEVIKSVPSELASEKKVGPQQRRV